MDVIIEQGVERCVAAEGGRFVCGDRFDELMKILSQFLHIACFIKLRQGLNVVPEIMPRPFGSPDVLLLGAELTLLQLHDSVLLPHFRQCKRVGDDGVEDDQHQNPYNQLGGHHQDNIQRRQILFEEKIHDGIDGDVGNKNG